MTANINRQDIIEKEARPHNRRLAKKRAQCLNEALCPARAGFSAGRLFCASKSASSPSAKTLCVILEAQRSLKLTT